MSVIFGNRYKKVFKIPIYVGKIASVINMLAKLDIYMWKIEGRLIFPRILN